MNKKELLQQCIHHPNNIHFDDFVGLIEAFGFVLVRKSSSHHIFKHPEIPELMNLQNVKGEAKPYQIRQFLKTIERNDLKLKE